jgi:hypothetical protein
MLLVNRRPGVGRVLVTISEEHGIHAGDVPVIAAWVLGLVCCALLWRDSRSS